jgi:hypothetical protein
MAIKRLPSDDLADLGVVLHGIMVHLLIGPLGKGMPSHLARSAVRLTDQAVADYKQAHRHLQQFVENQDFGGFIGAQGRFESSIISLHRALRYFHALRRQGIKLADGSALIPRPNECPLLREVVLKKLAEIRHAILHLDERLCEAPRPVGDPVALDLRDSGVYLNGHSLSWTEITQYLRQAHQLAGRLGRR